MRVVADAQGARTPGYQFRPDSPKPSPWRARWIWLADERMPPVAMYRKVVTLNAAPKRVRAWVSGDRKYRLYVNGRLVSRGPVDIGKDYAGGSTGRWFYDCRNLSAYFHKGANVIAAEVFREWPIGFTETRGHPSFLFEANVESPDRRRITVATDWTWRALPAAQYPDSVTYDASKEPLGWRAAGYDDGAWTACHELKDVWQRLIQSEIPPLIEVRYPVMRIEGLPSRTITADGSFRVVFDRVLSGYPTLKVRGGNGATLTIRAHRTAVMRLGEGVNYFEFPFLAEIAPSFTVEVKNVRSPVEILDVGANFTSQPVDNRGAFECSEPECAFR